MASLDPGSDSGNVSSTGSNGAHGGEEAIGGTLATIDNRSQAVIPPVNWGYGPPARPEILSAKPNPIELLHATRRRWPLAVGLGVTAATLAAVAVWFLVPVRYEAFALLKVSGQQPSVLMNENSAPENFIIFKRTQVQLILSNIVLQRTVAEPAISRLSIINAHSNDPVSWLKNQLLIDYPDDSEVMRIALKGTKKDEVTKIVNAVVDKYLKEIVQHEREVRMEQESKLERSYSTYAEDYQKQLAALRKLHDVHKTSSSEAAQLKKKLAFEQLSEMLTLRTRIADQISQNEMAIMLAKARQDNPEEAKPADAIIDMELGKDPLIQQSTHHLGQLNDQLVAELAHAVHPENSSRIKQLKKRIQHLEDSLDERKATLRPRLEMQLAATMGSGQSNPNNQLNLPMLLKQKEHLTAMYDKANENVMKQGEVLENLESFSANVVGKQEELIALQKITNELRAELNRIRVERLAPERIVKLDEASLSNSNGDAMRKYVALVFAALLSFGVVVVSVALVEFQARKVNSVQEVNDGLGIRVIGELPSVSGRTWRRAKGGQGPRLLKALMAERIDGVRTAIIHTTSIDPPRVVMVTSAEPHEGKTTTATQLAASLARSGRRTLLIDADVRSPGVHRVFELPNEPGLCELLRGEADRDGVIQPTRTANLWLLPAGRCDLRSVQALSTSFLGTTIAAVCVQFDYIVIDSGPVLKIADPLLIGQHVDAVVLSVLRDNSRVPNVYEASERLRSVGINVLGAVINGVKDDAARHGVELLMAETTAARPDDATATSDVTEEA